MHALSSPLRSPRSLLIALALAAGPLALPQRCMAGAGGTGTRKAEVTVEPKTFQLVGRRATQQMIATERGSDGSIRDATRSVEWVVKDPRIASVNSRGRVVPAANGSTLIVARLGQVEVAASLSVEGMDHAAPVSFRRDVIPAFSQAGCNMGACHGTPTGKGGFRLSLRGYLPDQDFAILSREAGGRRINPMAAETSLILRKPLGEVPHEGGLRLTRSSKTYEFLHDWVQEGATDDPGGPEAHAVGGRCLRPRVLDRPGVDPAIDGAGHMTRPAAPRRHADLLLRLVQPRDRRGRRRGLRPVQDPGRGGGHRPLPESGRQRPTDAPGRGARLRRCRGRRAITSWTRRYSPSSTGCGSGRRRPAPTASSSAGPISTSSACCPTPDEVASFLAWPAKDAPRQGRGRAAGTQRVLRLLGAQVRRHPAVQRPADPVEGGVRLPSLDPRFASSATCRWTSSSANC